MPFLDVTLPRTSAETKRKLIARLTDAAVEAGFEREIFRVCIREYQIGDAGRAGVPWDGGAESPPLHLVLYTPRLPVRMKKAAIEKFSRAFLEVLAKPEWWPIVHILEYSYDNLGIQGRIAWEAHPELKNQKFYNNLPDD
jgi:phenylpyruvate tautomerase PptA (4-oxalocrotonate tautomerase family)